MRDHEETTNVRMSRLAHLKFSNTSFFVQGRNLHLNEQLAFEIDVAPALIWLRTESADQSTSSLLWAALSTLSTPLVVTFSTVVNGSFPFY